ASAAAPNQRRGLTLAHQSPEEIRRALGGIMQWTSTRTINAPPERVFHVVANPEEFQQAIVGGSTVEYLTPSQSGVGAKFRATRIMKGTPTAFDQEVTAFVPGDRIRLLNVTQGTVWESEFRVQPAGAGASLTLTMEAKPSTLVARLLTLLIRQ